jgi:hypothetical protein
MSLNEEQKSFKSTDELSEKIDIVIVWHEKWKADIFAEFLRKQYAKKVDIYYSCDSFLQEFKKYPKDTKICFNYTLENGKTAPQIAEIIYPEGYTNIYLYTAYSAEYLKKEGVPNYLTVLFKDDVVSAVETFLK